MVGAAPVSDDHLLQYIRGVYNQGSVPSCVAHSSAGMQSINEQMERGTWIEMDALRCYRDNGGNGTNGVDTQRVLSYMQSQGMPIVGSALRYKLATYAFAQPMQQAGVEAIKAAIATGHPCVVALLLPTDWMSGMNAGLGAVNTAAYHQVVLVAYTPDRVTFLNSWGSQYGQNGLGSIPWSYLQRSEQQGRVYAYTEVDAPDEDGTPRPPDPPIPDPPIPPVALTIADYQGAAGYLPKFVSDSPITIHGTGFDAGVLQVTFGAAQLPVSLRSGTSITVTAPKAEVPTAGAIRVQREAMAVSGPMLVVVPKNGTPLPTPPPPVDRLAVQVAIVKRQTVVGIYAVVHDVTGGLVTAICMGTAGSVPLGPKSANSSGVPATWQVARHDGDLVMITAVAIDGRTGTGSATI